MPNLRHMRVRELLKRELNEIFRRHFPVDLGVWQWGQKLHRVPVQIHTLG